ECRAPEAAYLSGCGPDCALREYLAAGYGNVEFACELQPVEGTDQRLPGRRRLRFWRPGIQPDRRDTGAGARDSCVGGVFPAFWRAGVTGAHVYAAGGQPRRRERGGDRLRILAAEIRREPEDRGKRDFAEQRVLHGGRRARKVVPHRCADRPVGTFPDRSEQHEPGPLFLCVGTVEAGSDAGTGKCRAKVVRGSVPAASPGGYGAEGRLWGSAAAR